LEILPPPSFAAPGGFDPPSASFLTMLLVHFCETELGDRVQAVAVQCSTFAPMLAECVDDQLLHLLAVVLRHLGLESAQLVPSTCGDVEIGDERDDVATARDSSIAVDLHYPSLNAQLDKLTQDTIGFVKQNISVIAHSHSLICNPIIQVASYKIIFTRLSHRLYSE